MCLEVHTSSGGYRSDQESVESSHKVHQKVHYSVTEVEVVIGVSVVLALAEDGADEVESAGGEGDAHPDAHAVVNDDTVHEEALDATIEEVEEPLLGSVGAVMPDVTTSVRGLLVEVLLAVPCAPLSLGDSEAFAVDEAHVASVALFVVGKSTSCSRKSYETQDVQCGESS